MVRRKGYYILDATMIWYMADKALRLNCAHSKEEECLKIIQKIKK